MISPIASRDLSVSEAHGRIPQQVLSQEDFLKLIVVQMTQQDPLNPMKETEFIAQMASFSALEQSKAMQQDMAAMRREQQLAQATGLIDREVMVAAQDGTFEMGVVSGVVVLEEAPKIVVNGRAYALSAVRSVTPATTNRSETEGVQS